MGSKSPKDRVVGPIPNGLPKWPLNGGDPDHWTKSWDDPPGTELNIPPERKIIFNSVLGPGDILVPWREDSLG